MSGRSKQGPVSADIVPSGQYPVVQHAYPVRACVTQNGKRAQPDAHKGGKGGKGAREPPKGRQCLFTAYMLTYGRVSPDFTGRASCHAKPDHVRCQIRIAHMSTWVPQGPHDPKKPSGACTSFFTHVYVRFPVRTSYCAEGGCARDEWTDVCHDTRDKICHIWSPESHLHEKSGFRPSHSYVRSPYVPSPRTDQPVPSRGRIP